jgi:hypothetical protein
MAGHLIADIAFREERIVCSCGELVTAAPDEGNRERHKPLDEAWAAHRRANGCQVLTVAKVMSYRRATVPWASWRRKGRSLRPDP